MRELTRLNYGEGRRQVLELTLITYRLSSAGPVRLVIYNVLGQPVRTLVDGSRAAGSYQVKWDARDEGGLYRPAELSWRRAEVFAPTKEYS